MKFQLNVKKKMLKKHIRAHFLVTSHYWREHLKKSIGQDFSAKPMLEYFKPLMAYLQKINAGRKYTLPEQPDFNYQSFIKQKNPAEYAGFFIGYTF